MSCRLYLITPPVLAEDFESQLAAALDAGDVAAVQLRLKDAPDAEVIKAIERLRPVAQARDVAFLINDRPDLAKRHGCDGAHVGQTDMKAPAARKILGDLMLGVTCHGSRHLAMQAGEDGADYVAFGAFFPTTTKTPPAMADMETLAWWAEVMEVPCVAIGGITAQNCGPLVRAGADFLAVVGAVWGHAAGPAAGVRAMVRAIAEAGGEAALSQPCQSPTPSFPRKRESSFPRTDQEDSRFRGNDGVDGTTNNHCRGA